MLYECDVFITDIWQQQQEQPQHMMHTGEYVCL